MKKRIGLIFTILTAVAVVCVCAFLIGCTANSYTYSRSGDYSVGASSFAASDISSLDIDWLNGDVDIVYADVEEISISETATRGEITSDFKLRYLLEDGTLKIKYAKSGRWHFGNLKKTLTVSLPTNTTLDEFEVDAASANVTANKLVCNKTDIDIASGNVKIENASISDLDIDSASGSVTVDLTGARSVSVDSASGNVNITARTAPSSIDIDTASGDVKIRLPEDAGFSLKFDAASGDFDTDFTVTKSGKTYVCGDGSADIKVDTASGDLTIEKI